MPDSFSRSFLAGEGRAESLLPASFRDRTARAASVARASQRLLAGGVLEILREQNRTLPRSNARNRNLEALGARGTVAVVTGQQVGLFLGPLYSFYKAASAIAVARALEMEAGTRCVPVFWLQTEDHDFAEINHCHVLSPDGEAHELSLKDDVPGTDAARISVKHRALGEEINRPLEMLEELLGELPYSSELLPLLKRHYRPGQTLAAAFAGVMAELFSGEGLVIFDPRDGAVARLTTQTYLASLTAFDRISELLAERCRALEGAGFEAQVHIRTDSPLFFWHEHGPEGPRFRLEWRGSAWQLCGKTRLISTDELVRALKAEPLQFSSSALLRPIIQDSLFPTAAYVGGPGELNYFAQLPPLYDFFQIPLPLIVPRARFRCIEAKARSLLNNLNLGPSDAERPREELVRQAVRAGAADYPRLESVNDQLMEDVSKRLDVFEAMAKSLDPNLLKAVRRTRGTVAHAVSRLAARYNRSLMERDRIANDRVDRLQALLFPNGIPQERYYSLPYFACKYGIREFKEKVFAGLDPFEAAIRDLQL